jgi:transketolase
LLHSLCIKKRQLSPEKEFMMTLQFGPRRAVYINILEDKSTNQTPLAPETLKIFEDFDRVYRTLCAVMFNYVPLSGHPGGSVSSGRFVSSLLFDGMDYDFSDPDRQNADMISYAAGHKALGLYAMWALRNEIMRIGANDMLPSNVKLQLRLEDLLGFRRNPITDSPLFQKYGSKALDGHPTPTTPFIKLSTGASGVGLASSIGLAFGAADMYGPKAPKVHIIEGEGGMTPGRVVEALAAAGTASLANVVLHVDWNQASIDSNRVCRDGQTPGDYVQWEPAELAYLHDWNVIYVPDGKDFQQIIAAQRKAASLRNGQPTAIVYRTIKGWQYGIEGRASHGAGHKLCSPQYYQAVGPLFESAGVKLNLCEGDKTRCSGGNEGDVLESCFWEALTVLRRILEGNRTMVDHLAGRIKASRQRLEEQKRTVRANAPTPEKIYEFAAHNARVIPAELTLKVGASTTLRAELGRTLNYYNKLSGGALMVASADLLGSTSVTAVVDGFPQGYYHAGSNPLSRTLSIGGICEDAMAGILAGISTFGGNIGVGSSYGAFLAPLGHIAARLHAIGNQSRHSIAPDPYKPFFLICAHAGVKTGEDGPTHADPQALQLLQENFPRGTVITLTPWDPQELWPLVSASLAHRPAVIAPYVTRPNETILDRAALKLAPVSDAVTGLYALRKANGKGDGTLVIQGSGVAYAFLQDALPRLEKAGVDLNVYYVASAELFDLLPLDEQERIFPDAHAREAMGISGFTLPTLYRWITSKRGRAASLYPFKHGHFLGSGQAPKVLREAGLDGESQFQSIMQYIKEK